MAELIARRAGPVEATIAYVTSNQSRVVLYCVRRTATLPLQARDISAEEMRDIYALFCA